ncbi:MAG: dihydrolipoyl dehydrogenase [Chloroflexi bacterium]|nr:dihydrolipoyl dehydrogenase [Chloroflexota bacterium]MBU1750776.1 dihydrolipoyl dehydrogenase [Chloroflexota bacterium]
MTEPYDIVIIGGGPGGYVAALRAVQLGATVALVEMERVGGTCLNRGCIPTKAMVRGAEVFKLVQEAATFGVETGEVRLDFCRFMARKDEVVETLVSGVERLLESGGVALYPGRGRIAGGTADGWRVTVRGLDGSEQDVTGRKVIIATGSVPARVPIPGTDLLGVVTSRELLRLQKQPRRLVVIGGSVVGLEFASIFATLGTQVSVVGRKTFLKDTDPQLAKRFRPLLARQGVSVNIGLEFRDIVQTDDGTLQVRYEQRGKEGHVEGDVVLLSTGRWPYTEGVGVEELGIAMSKRDILVNETLETSVPGIYAIGDCIGGAMLAHVASYEGEVAVENIMGHRRKVDYTVVPACIFTMPEIADVGLTEEQAKEQSIAHTVSMFPFTASGKALAQGETEGQVRLVCEEGTGKVLGMHIMGPHASDLIAEGAMAMRLGATARDIAELIHAHPTLPEAVMEAGKEQLDGAIHYQRRRR